ncbi:MAG: Maf family protein [Mycobacterium sp.]
MTRVVLASASAGRLRVLRSAGIDPMVVVSGVDEDALMNRLGPDADPARVVTALAEAKAEAAAATLDTRVSADCVVIGCDSMLYVGGTLSGKPGTPEQALRQWNSMAGRDGELFTGHCVIRMSDARITHTGSTAAVTTVRFGVPSADELRAYIASGEPLGVAGGFTLDGLGGWFVDSVDGDPANVIGLSLPATRRLLESVGLELGELWGANR